MDQSRKRGFDPDEVIEWAENYKRLRPGAKIPSWHELERVQKANEAEGEMDIVTTLPQELSRPDDNDDENNGRLKEHQKAAVRFLYDKIFDGKDHGAIIAHSMGLGKTSITLTFLFAILTNSKVSKSIKKILIVAPKNAHQQWKNEFLKWKPKFGNRANNIGFEILKTKANSDPAFTQYFEIVKKWYNEDTVDILIVNYEMYKNLVHCDCKRCSPELHKTLNCNCKKCSSKEYIGKCSSKEYIDLKTYLQTDGPDIAVFDEGHKLKNNKLVTYKEMNKIKTKRRIILTGTPIQNNLKELYSVVEFVYPNLLPSEEMFLSEFGTKIEEGNNLHVKYEISREMADELYTLLMKNVMHRRDADYLKSLLKVEKTEVTISLLKTTKQAELLKSLAKEYAKEKPKNFLKYYHSLGYIVAHPIIYDTRNVGEPEDQKKRHHACLSRKLGNTNNIEKSNYKYSSKMEILFEIIAETEKRNEKLVVFAEFLTTLIFIEHHLKRKFWWKEGTEYFRVDGTLSNCTARGKKYDKFNTSEDARVFLLSTKAACVGIDLYGATRMVLFDHNFNPTWNRQAVHRIYRFGQKKDVFVYRLEVKNCDDAVLRRQIKKETLAKRVIDKKEILSKFTYNDIKIDNEKLSDDADRVAQRINEEVKPIQRKEIEMCTDEFLRNVLFTLSKKSNSCVEAISNYDDNFIENCDNIISSDGTLFDVVSVENETYDVDIVQQELLDVVEEEDEEDDYKHEDYENESENSDNNNEDDESENSDNKIEDEETENSVNNESSERDVDDITHELEDSLNILETNDNTNEESNEVNESNTDLKPSVVLQQPPVKRETTFAIDDVYVICANHPLVKDIKVRYSNCEYEMLEALKKGCTQQGFLNALTIMVCSRHKNKENNSWKCLMGLISRIANNSDNKHHKLKIANDTVQKILGVKYVQDVLEIFGYVKEDNEYLRLFEDKIPQSIVAAKEFIVLKDNIGDAVFDWELDPDFGYVKNAAPLKESKLPLAFFGNDIETFSCSIELPIHIINKRRREYSFSSFSLIRITFQDSDLFYQRVFRKTALLSDVDAAINVLLQELNLNTRYKMFKENGDEITDMNKSIEQTFPFFSANLLIFK